MIKKQLPIDSKGNPVQNSSPVGFSLAETYDSSISSSTEITFNAGTVFIQVSAVDKGIFMKWGTDNATNADFDEFICANETKIFEVPTGTAAANFIEEQATAHLLSIEK